MSAASILEPIVNVFEEAFQAEDYDKVIDFYHPEATVVQCSKKAVYGRDNLLAFFKSFGESMGKTESKISDRTYEGSENYIAYSAKYVSESEKIGTVQGTFFQIWKKESGKWLVIYDNFVCE